MRYSIGKFHNLSHFADNSFYLIAEKKNDIVNEIYDSRIKTLNIKFITENYS